jgi:hypothetical protein
LDGAGGHNSISIEGAFGWGVLDPTWIDAKYDAREMAALKKPEQARRGCYHQAVKT